MRNVLRILAGLAFVVATSNATQANIVGWWELNGDFTNSAGPASDGATAYGTPTFAAGVHGQAGSFDGSSAIAVPTIGDPMNSTIFTLAYFVQSTGQDGLFERITARDSNSFFTAIADGSTQLGPSGGFQTNAVANELSYWQTTTAGPSAGNEWFGWDHVGQTTAANDWTHVAWVHDGTDMKLYIDGTLVYTGGSLASTPTGQLYLGGNASDNGESMIGLLDDVLLTDNALGANDIAFIANNGVARWIPEPASLSLLGIGGLMVLRRRR